MHELLLFSGVVVCHKSEGISFRELVLMSVFTTVCADSSLDVLRYARS